MNRLRTDYYKFKMTGGDFNDLIPSTTNLETSDVMNTTSVLNSTSLNTRSYTDLSSDISLSGISISSDEEEKKESMPSESTVSVPSSTRSERPERPERQEYTNFMCVNEIHIKQTGKIKFNASMSKDPCFKFGFTQAEVTWAYIIKRIIQHVNPKLRVKFVTDVSIEMADGTKHKFSEGKLEGNLDLTEEAKISKVKIQMT